MIGTYLLLFILMFMVGWWLADVQRAWQHRKAWAKEMARRDADPMYEHGCLKVNVVSPMDRIRGGMLGPLTPFKFKPSKHPAADYAAGSTTAPGVKIALRDYPDLCPPGVKITLRDYADLCPPGVIVSKSRDTTMSAERMQYNASRLSGYTPGPVE